MFISISLKILKSLNTHVRTFARILSKKSIDFFPTIPSRRQCPTLSYVPYQPSNRATVATWGDNERTERKDLAAAACRWASCLAVNCYMHWHAASRTLKSHFWWQCQRWRRYTRKHSRFPASNSFRSRKVHDTRLFAQVRQAAKRYAKKETRIYFYFNLKQGCKKLDLYILTLMYNLINERIYIYAY